MLVVLFESRTLGDVNEAAYEEAFRQMLERVHEVPGFVDFASYSGADGAELAVARFEDDLALARWREHEEHVCTRERGREEFFEAYDITVASVVRQYSWRRTPGERLCSQSAVGGLV
ncbi:antibiotic biosynthesis monooxygenase [Georgenia sp. 10Sc9-8]|uniref:Antibiotic biosynthesis monooxygenase n=1 Tax=Georgenia halotolerans TaxID=3028317 RepID=A0ABT5TYX1_9MICO|nr:antibiotic biosynthesis monooxygenase [Georgenia halotolerans]